MIRKGLRNKKRKSVGGASSDVKLSDKDMPGFMLPVDELLAAGFDGCGGMREADNPQGKPANNERHFHV